MASSGKAAGVTAAEASNDLSWGRDGRNQEDWELGSKWNIVGKRDDNGADWDKGRGKGLEELHLTMAKLGEKETCTGVMQFTYVAGGTSQELRKTERSDNIVVMSDGYSGRVVSKGVKVEESKL
eukprot:jgi/Psemu1/283564/fgenesh1_pg.29_\